MKAFKRVIIILADQDTRGAVPLPLINAKQRTISACLLAIGFAIEYKFAGTMFTQKLFAK